jgi:hypothetical protein
MKNPFTTNRAHPLVAGILTVAALVVLSAHHPNAAVATQTFDTAAAYTAAAGPELWLIDFNISPGAAVPGNSFGPDVTFSSPESATPAMVIWSSDALTDTGSTTAPNNVGPIGGVFTSTVNAFAFEYLSGGLGSVTLYDAGGSEIAALTPLSNSGFFGVVSDTPIKSFVIVGREFTEAELPGGGTDRIFIDNFRVNQLLSIEALCPCAGPWQNHGAYLSCVTTAARQLRDAGVISSIGPHVSAAAKSNCGK